MKPTSFANRTAAGASPSSEIAAPCVVRRTFAASKHPRDSAERSKLNESPETSEYNPSMRFALKEPFLMSDGTVHPTQPFTYHRMFRTKREATDTLTAL